MESRHRTQTRWTQRLTEGLRELLRTPVRFALHIALARLLTQWRTLLTIIAGTILSASIGALVPLYTTAVSQVGMTQRLAEEPARDVHVQANISLRANTCSRRFKCLIPASAGWIASRVSHIRT